MTSALVGATVALFAAAGLYRIKLSPSALDEAPAIAAWLLIISALAAAFRHWLGDDVIVPTDRLRLLGLMILAVILVVDGEGAGKAEQLGFATQEPGG